MSSIKQRIKRAVFELYKLFSDLLNEIVKSTKTLTDLPIASTSGKPVATHSSYLQLQVHSQRETILHLTHCLIEKDKEIQSLLHELHEHQLFQQSIIQLQQRVNEKDEQLTQLSHTLQTVHSKLLETLHETKPILDSIARTKQLKMSDVLSYSHLISGTTSGPPTNDRGLERVHVLPYPQPHQWGQSLLYPSKFSFSMMRVIFDLTR